MEEKFQQAVESLKAFAKTHNGMMRGNDLIFTLTGTAIKEVYISIKMGYKNERFLYTAGYSWYNLPKEEVDKVNAMEFTTPNEAYTIVGRANAINNFFNEL